MTGTVKGKKYTVFSAQIRAPQFHVMAASAGGRWVYWAEEQIIPGVSEAAAGVGEVLSHELILYVAYRNGTGANLKLMHCRC
jgi:hypothetical protein